MSAPFGSDAFFDSDSLNVVDTDDMQDAGVDIEGPFPGMSNTGDTFPHGRG